MINYDGIEWPKLGGTEPPTPVPAANHQAGPLVYRSETGELRVRSALPPGAEPLPFKASPVETMSPSGPELNIRINRTSTHFEGDIDHETVGRLLSHMPSLLAGTSGSRAIQASVNGYTPNNRPSLGEKIGDVTRRTKEIKASDGGKVVGIVLKKLAVAAFVTDMLFSVGMLAGSQGDEAHGIFLNPGEFPAVFEWPTEYGENLNQIKDGYGKVPGLIGWLL